MIIQCVQKQKFHWTGHPVPIHYLKAGKKGDTTHKKIDLVGKVARS